MTVPEAELQATANLSPVSPSPVHSASPLVVPALQDTVDTIDAMVAAVSEATASTSAVDVDDAMSGAPAAGDAAAGADCGHVVDDDSLDGAYGDDNAATTDPTLRPRPEPSDTNDDYAKTFDSPIDPEEGGGQDIAQHVPSSMPPESNNVLTTSRSPDAAADTVAHDPSAAHDAAPANHVASWLPGASADESQQPADAQAPSMAPSEPAAEADADPSLDIQKLVADLTAQPTESSSSDADPASASSVFAKVEAPEASSTSLTPSTSLPSSSSLPPRPPLPQSTVPQSYASQQHAAGPNPNAPGSNAGAGSAPGQPPTYAAVTGTLGASTEPPSSLPPPPATTGPNAPPTVSSLNAPPCPSQAASGYSNERGPDADFQRQWDQFMTDERQYMSEAKWDRFPEGSRIFIGNLSSDKVSKRDVFDVFHRYGRLAQISLKSAYGFVQYHTVDEGRLAMENLQGAEIKGRRIHLEISRAQEKSKKDRGRSPDRGRGGRDGGRRNDKHHQGRDDYRPGRHHSPRRNDRHARDEGLGRDRGFHDAGRGGRGRSRSPGYGRNDRDSYRRRSPSPYGRSRHEADLDLPRRYGADVPDVQIILQPEVNRDFVTWVESAFKAKGLKTEVMYLHPRFPKDQVVQRQAAEGVHGVVDLDLRAQSLGRIPVQAFDRSAGGSNVRFDQYVDLDPGTAAEVIVRAKATAAASYGQGYAAAGGYANPYAGQHQQPPHGAANYATRYPTQQPQPQPQPQQHVPQNAADIASLAGHVDNATLQRLLSSIQGAPQAQGGIPTAAVGYGVGTPAPAVNAQVDIQAILGSLGGSGPAQQHAPPPGQYGAGYGAQASAAPNGGASAASGGGDAAAQVQNIMAQLARYRQ